MISGVEVPEELKGRVEFNSRERYLDEWKALLAAADKRFALHKVVQLEGSLLAMLEVHWDVSFVKA